MQFIPIIKKKKKTGTKLQIQYVIRDCDYI